MKKKLAKAKIAKIVVGTRPQLIEYFKDIQSFNKHSHKKGSKFWIGKTDLKKQLDSIEINVNSRDQSIGLGMVFYLKIDSIDRKKSVVGGTPQIPQVNIVMNSEYVHIRNTPVKDAVKKSTVIQNLLEEKNNS